MTPEETLNHGKQFSEKLGKLEARARADTDGRHLAVGLKAQVLDFLRATAGPKSAFAQQVEDLKPTSDWYQAAQLAAIIQAFVSHLERGLGGAISLERKAQSDSVTEGACSPHDCIEQGVIAGEGAMSVKGQAPIEDLYKVEGKAELINGEIVLMPPAGDEPASAGLAIAASLRA